MARICVITGKKTIYGRNVPRKGLPKKKGGAGQHIGVKTQRTFKVNLQKKKFFIPSLNRNVSVRLSVSALRNISKIGLERFLQQNCDKIKSFV